MTYGWAILVVLIAIAALSYFGVLKPDMFVSSKCLLPAGITCLDFTMGTSSVTVVLQNSIGETITIDKVTVAKKDADSCSNIESRMIKNNEKTTLTLLGCNNGDIGEKFDGEINITYTKEDALTHTIRGRMVARITAGDDDQGDDENGDDNGDDGENITCSSDLDCGTSGFVGDYYCVADYITQNQTNYTCSNAGTVNSSCSVLNTSVQLTYCDPDLDEVCVVGNATCGTTEITPNIEIIQITTNSLGAYNPDIYNDKIVWEEFRNGSYEIFMYDISTGLETQITSDPPNQGEPSIYDNIIVWQVRQKFEPFDIDVYMYDISTGIETQITNSTSVYESNPFIYGDKIVWNERGIVKMCDLSIASGPGSCSSDNTHTQITSGGVEYATSIYENKIVWRDFRVFSPLSDADIYMYDISTGQETRLTIAPTSDSGGNIYGDKIVWSDATNGKNEVYIYDITTGQGTVLLPESISESSYPDIQGTKIVWMDERDSSYDLYMYDLSTGLETRITTGPDFEEYPEIYGNKIVWDNDDVDIYLAIIS